MTTTRVLTTAGLAPGPAGGQPPPGPRPKGAPAHRRRPARRRRGTAPGPLAAPVWGPEPGSGHGRLWGPQAGGRGQKLCLEGGSQRLLRHQKATSICRKTSPIRPRPASTWPGSSTPATPMPYRGLGVVESRQSTPDASIALLQQALAIAPTNTLVLSDLGASYLIRYGTGKKKKDLNAGPGPAPARRGPPTLPTPTPGSSWPAATTTRRNTPRPGRPVHQRPVPEHRQPRL